jgi:hypothetical protein
MAPLAYYITVETRDSFDAQEFTAVAGQLCNALQSTLGDLTTLRSLTHTPTLSNARVEVEIAQTDSEKLSPIAARAIVKAAGGRKASFDKNLFTRLVRDVFTPPVRITKQAVATDDLS